jgi:ketosteroid isomerase-like protein
MPRIGQINQLEISTFLRKGDKGMKTAHAVIIVLVLLLLSGCAQKVNDPADAQAIRNLNADYDKAASSQDLAWLSSNFYTDDAVALPPNQPMVKGKEAIASEDKSTFDQYSPTQLSGPVEEVLSSGDLAVARGAYTWTGTPKASGLSEVSEQGKWIGTFRRQGDGSWKCSQLIWNSDLPAAGATVGGADERALLQIERDWTDALIKKNRSALEKILAEDFVSHGPEGVRNKRQLLAGFMSNAFKVESAEISDMHPVVFGDTAVVHGLLTEKSKTGGKDTSGQYRWTDIFEKRDGRWQCVGSYATKIG